MNQERSWQDKCTDAILAGQGYPPGTMPWRARTGAFLCQLKNVSIELVDAVTAGQASVTCQQFADGWTIENARFAASQAKKQLTQQATNKVSAGIHQARDVVKEQEGIELAVRPGWVPEPVVT